MRVALYARVSTEEQAVHGLSIDAQTAALDEWAKNHVVVDHYVDLGISARKPITKRQELQRLLRDVENGRVDLIVFTKLDRWTRNIREYYKAQDILDAHNVAWRAIHEDYETETAAGRLKVNIMLAVAQDEADRTSERIKAVFADKRRKGLVPTGKVPIGVRIENGHYVASEDAPRVREMFATYITTRSAPETARRTGMTSNGIRYMMANHVYVEAGVVDEHTFKTAGKVLESRSQRHVRSDRVYIFSGLIICPRCGRKLTALTSNGYKYYRCQRHVDGRCEGCHVSEVKLENYLLDHLISEVGKVNLTIRKKQKRPVDTNKLKAKLNKLTDLYLNDLIDRDKYEFEFKQTQTAIADAEQEDKPLDTAEIKTVLEAYRGLSDEGKKAFWSRILTSVTPTEKGYDFALNYTYRNKSEDILTFVQMSKSSE